MSLDFKTLEGGVVSLTGETLEAFQARLRGELLTRASPGYESSRALWNAAIERHPALIVRCEGTEDVLTCIRFARTHRLRTAAKGGGHGIAGHALVEGGLVLDLSPMRSVQVDPRSRVVRAEAGCLLRDVDAETQRHGLATVLGFVSETGVAGLTLGGGFGYLSRRFGWTTDSLLAVELVTADGRLLRVSEEEHPDLFWALRGGGGNFGVVTAFEYRLHPVGPEIFAGVVAWRAEEAGEVLDFLRRFAEQAPPELVCGLLLRKAPPAPWLPKEIHGQDVVMALACHTGDPSEAERILAPLRGIGRPVADAICRRTYVEQQRFFDATQPRGRRYYWKSEYLPRLEPELLERVREHGKRVPTPFSAIFLFQLGGAIRRLPEDHSAAGNRDAEFVLNIMASWETPADDGRAIGWARDTWQDLRGFSTGGVYVNFLTEEEGEDRIRAAYARNLERLARLKATWDPENFFRANKNIPPAAPAEGPSSPAP